MDEKTPKTTGVSTWVTIVACIIGLGIITPFVGGSTIAGFTSTVGRDSTLTGRTDIWAGLLPDVMRQPFLGYGFSSFWTSPRIYQHNIGEAHNGYLEVCLGLGFVGLIPTVMFLLSGTRKAVTLLRKDYDWATLCICFLVMTVVHNITESSFPLLTTHLTATVLFLSVSLPRPIGGCSVSDRRGIREANNVLVEGKRAQRKTLRGMAYITSYSKALEMSTSVCRDQ